MLQETACQPFESEANASEAAMLQHDVAEILEALDERDDVDRNALAKLEWKYLLLIASLVGTAIWNKALKSHRAGAPGFPVLATASATTQA